MAQQIVSYWLVKLDPQPKQNVMEYKFEHIGLVWDSINITWSKFPQHERPVIEAVDAINHVIRDHSGTKIGTIERVSQTIEIYSEPTHF